jgi:TRAP-type C4-dicarboxylate transport system permease small subunit
MISAIRPLYEVLSRFEKVFYKFLTVLAVGVLGFVVLAVIFQVFYREIIIKFVSFSFPFTEEFARFGIIWVAYLLLPVCLKEGRHATVTLIIDKIDKKAKYGFYFFIQAVSLAFYIVTFVFSFKNIIINLPYVSPSMRLPGIWIYSSVTLGLAFAVIQIIIEISGVTSGALAPFYNILTDELTEITGGKK